MSDYEFWSLPGDDLLGDPFDQRLDRKLRRQLIGAHICFGGGKGGGGSAPSPDPQIGQAALMQAETGQQWLDFAKEQFAIGNERQKGIDELTNQVTGAQLESMKDSNARSEEMWNRYQTVFKPEQDRYIKEARDWDSEQRQQEVAAEAKATVMGNAAAAQQQNQRQMASMGVSPASGRYVPVSSGQTPPPRPLALPARRTRRAARCARKAWPCRRASPTWARAPRPPPRSRSALV